MSEKVPQRTRRARLKKRCIDVCANQTRQAKGCSRTETVDKRPPQGNMRTVRTKPMNIGPQESSETISIHCQQFMIVAKPGIECGVEVQRVGIVMIILSLPPSLYQPDAAYHLSM